MLLINTVAAQNRPFSSSRRIGFFESQQHAELDQAQCGQGNFGRQRITRSLAGRSGHGYGIGAPDYHCRQRG